MFSNLQIDEQHIPCLSTVFAVFMHIHFCMSSVVFMYPTLLHILSFFNHFPAISFLSLLSGYVPQSARQ